MTLFRKGIFLESVFLSESKAAFHMSSDALKDRVKPVQESVFCYKGNHQKTARLRRGRHLLQDALKIVVLSEIKK